MCVTAPPHAWGYNSRCNSRWGTNCGLVKGIFHQLIGDKYLAHVLVVPRARVRILVCRYRVAAHACDDTRTWSLSRTTSWRSKHSLRSMVDWFTLGVCATGCVAWLQLGAYVMIRGGDYSRSHELLTFGYSGESRVLEGSVARRGRDGPVTAQERRAICQGMTLVAENILLGGIGPRLPRGWAKITRVQVTIV